jgi:Holliday junction DNA helicase RuvA
MISYVAGILDSVGEQTAVVDVNGIGFEVFMSESALSALPRTGKQVKIYTYMNVREDCMQLFGFLSVNERKIFRLLIGVNGIGPKGALNILSVMSADELCYAVMGNDVKALSRAPGIGKKTAERLIIELKDKLDFQSMLEDSLSGGELSETGEHAVSDSVQSEAIQALTALGYGSSEAVKAVQKVSLEPDDTVESVLKQALKHMAFL